ncbi:envelope stress response membrane protein PspB [Paremcibacter congregatus]|uniref:Envelope stress response membrane protein PspB n=1 Tax=Paremcibacter congregatus TaxID=2043170 RepID=A0A2G4YP64_9PROT|nr:envelope stress response membrane protein PspB [Paremcibacter congregatus]PHZ84093.1 envelope stress response membrane protein PspB [Paremcibacter congregatus]QDE25846.1 envelope stress response membrane protein PspB [Paremcibacter congregatus]|tara:strand:+ start:1034 stop:1249 length:216 start_codon:yes stop_codon:yes gene_type:complete
METLGILFMVIVAPLLIIFHYTTKWKQSKTLTSEDEKILTELWDSAERIEGRIQNIERILDTESPDWRDEK